MRSYALKRPTTFGKDKQFMSFATTLPERASCSANVAAAISLVGSDRGIATLPKVDLVRQ